MTLNRGMFQRGRNRLVTCRGCGKATHSSVDGCRDLALCRTCLERAGRENTHSDENHPGPVETCPRCAP